LLKRRRHSMREWKKIDRGEKSSLNRIYNHQVASANINLHKLAQMKLSHNQVPHTINLKAAKAEERLQCSKTLHKVLGS
jgi:hypothetical protein